MILSKQATRRGLLRQMHGYVALCAVILCVLSFMRLHISPVKTCQSTTDEESFISTRLHGILLFTEKERCVDVEAGFRDFFRNVQWTLYGSHFCPPCRHFSPVGKPSGLRNEVVLGRGNTILSDFRDETLKPFIKCSLFSYHRRSMETVPSLVRHYPSLKHYSHSWPHSRRRQQPAIF